MLVFSVSSVVWADGEPPVSKEEYYENVAVGLGIVDEKLKDKEVITRADFALTLARLINEELKNSASTSYTDVPSGTKESAAIELLKSKEVMVGMGDGVFGPEEPILYAQATRLILKATKNIKEFDSKEIISESNYQILTKGIYPKEGGMLSYAMLVRLVYNALDMTIMEPEFGRIDTVSGNTDGDEYLIKHFFNMTRVSGVLETDMHSSIKETIIDGTNVSIDGIKYKSQKDYNESLGFKVDCFVDIDDNEVVFLTAHPDNEVKTISGKDLSYSTAERAYIYEENGRVKNIAIKSKTDVAYNDRVMMSSNNAAMVPTNGYVMFINNDKDSDIDVIRILQYTDIYISGRSTQEDQITIFETGGVSAVISTEEGKDGTVILNESGEVTTEKNLRAGAVVSVLSDYVGFVPNGNTVVARRAIISSDIIEGKLNMIDTSENALVVDGEIYYMNDRISAPSLGSNRSYTFYLNFMGKIAAKGGLDRTDLPIAVGYVIEADINSDGRCYARVLTYENEIVKFECAEKVRIEGVGTQKNQEVIKNNFMSNLGLIGFTVNADKEINKVIFEANFSSGKPTDVPQDLGIYKIGDSSVNGKTNSQGKKVYEYFKSFKSFTGRLLLKDDTIMFVIPESGALNASNCKVEPISSLVHTATYQVSGYVFDKNASYCDVIVVRGAVDNDATVKDSLLGVVTKITNTLNEDDEVTAELTIIGQDGEQVLCTKDANVVTGSKKISGEALGRKIVPGDAVLCAINMNNEISNIKVVYNKVTDEVYTSAEASDIGIGYTEDRDDEIIEGLVYDVDSKFIRLINKEKNASTATFGDIEIFSFERAGIFVLDEDAGEIIVKRGSVADVDSYLKNGNASRVLFKIAGYIGYYILVIK